MSEPRHDRAAPTRRTVLSAAAAVAGAAATIAIAPSATATTSPAATVPRLRGAVQSGAGQTARPLRRAQVAVLACGSGPAVVVGSGAVDRRGRFDVALGPAADARVLQVVADLGHGIVLSAAVRPGSSEAVVVNELSTVAVGYAFAQLLQHGRARGTALQLEIAAGMHDNIVDAGSGQVSAVLLASPNADQTTSLRTVRSAANLLAHCIAGGPRATRELLATVAPADDSAPASLVQAVAQIAKDPAHGALRLFELASRSHVFHPALRRAPDAWTVAVKVNDTGSPQHLFGGPANIAFDSRGYAWITNNVVQGTPASSTFNVVLRPDGRPSDGTGGTPLSPLVGGGILGAGFGVAADRDGSVWMGNFGWGGTGYQPSPETTGSLSRFAADGTPLCGASGIQGGPDRAQGIAVDALGTVWVASFGNNRLYVLPHGDAERSVFLQLPDGSCPFDVQLAADGSAWLTCSGGLQSKADSSVGRFRLVDGTVEQIWYRALGHSLKGMAVDSLGNAWIASGGDGCVYLLDPSGVVVGAYDGGGVDTPWSVSVDGDDHVWVANFGPEQIGSDYRAAAVSKLAGANPATRPAGVSVGDPLSPRTGYTLPSAGDPVLLADGSPLYGEGTAPSYTPLQRMTNVCIDAAGNAWAINNWKPRFDVDLVNPGGDGIVIFVGAAAPVLPGA